MAQFYTASEAIKKLGIPRSTFFVLVQTGQIPKVIPPLRKQAIYPKEEIDKIAASQSLVLQSVVQEVDGLKFVIPSKEDFEQIVEIDKLLFPGETWMTAKELQQRLPYNPEVTHILKNIKTNQVVGYISMSPLKQKTLEKLIELEIDETSLLPEDFAPYIPEMPLDCYVVSIAARPGSGISQQIYAGKLIYGVKDYLLELLNRGVIIKHIYTIATTRDGDRLAKNLGFHPLTNDKEWNSSYEDFRNVYILDLADKEHESELVKEYQNTLKNRNRRRKRYIKEMDAKQVQ